MPISPNQGSTGGGTTVTITGTNLRRRDRHRRWGRQRVSYTFGAVPALTSVSPTEGGGDGD